MVMEKENKFEIGQVVWLKSGGDPMTVVDVPRPYRKRFGYLCGTSGKKDREYPSKCLTAINPNKATPESSTEYWRTFGAELKYSLTKKHWRAFVIFNGAVVEGTGKAPAQALEDFDRQFKEGNQWD